MDFDNENKIKEMINQAGALAEMLYLSYTMFVKAGFSETQAFSLTNSLLVNILQMSLNGFGNNNEQI